MAFIKSRLSHYASRLSNFRQPIPNDYDKAVSSWYMVRDLVVSEAVSDMDADPLQSSRGITSFKAFRLTKTFLAAHKQKKYATPRYVIHLSAHSS